MSGRSRLPHHKIFIIRLRKIICLVIISLLICSCGANKAAVIKSNQIRSLDINKNETIAIVLRNVTDNNYDGLSESQKEKFLDSAEVMFSDCLSKNANSKNVQINVLPSKEARKHLRDIYSIDRYDIPASDIIDGIKTNNHKSSSAKNNLRYLLVIDIATNYSGNIDPTLDGDRGVFLVGMAKEGLKSTYANVHIIDLLNLSEVEYLKSGSEGREGWAAGVVVFLILPVPYYIPWWSDTESEVCNAIGKAVVDMMSPE